MEQNNSRKADRLKNLILPTTLASMILILIGSVVASKGYSYRFQSNSTRSRRVLSYFYLGKRAIHTGLNIPKADWQTGIRQFADQFGGLGMLIKFVGIPQGQDNAYRNGETCIV